MLKDFIVMFESSINKGILTNCDLSRYPVYAEVLPLFIKGDGEDFTSGCRSGESLKWLYNLICLNLYVFSLECVHNSEMCEDTLTDFETISKDLFGRLDTSIRYSLQKRGVSIKETVYIGFDTEYQQQTSTQNKLISAQMAVASQTVVKVPRQSAYKISQMDEKGNLIRLVKNSNVFNYVKLENSVKLCVDRARRLRNKDYDVLMLKMSEGLKMVRGVKYNEVEDLTTFKLPLSSITPYITFQSSVGLEHVLSVAQRISHPRCEKVVEMLFALFQHISTGGYSLDQGLESMQLGMYKYIESLDFGLAEEGVVLEDLVSAPPRPEGEAQCEKVMRRLVKT